MLLTGGPPRPGPGFDGRLPVRHGRQPQAVGAGRLRQGGLPAGGAPQLRGRLPAAAQTPQAEKGRLRPGGAPGGAALLPDGPPAGNPQAAAARPHGAVLPGAPEPLLGGRRPAAGHLPRPVPAAVRRRLKAGENHRGPGPGQLGDALPRGGDLGRRLGGIPLPAGAGGLFHPPALPPGPPGYGRGHALPGPGGGGHLRGGLFGGGARLVWPQLRAGAGHSPGELQR